MLRKMFGFISDTIVVILTMYLVALILDSLIGRPFYNLIDTHYDYLVSIFHPYISVFFLADRVYFVLIFILWLLIITKLFSTSPIKIARLLKARLFANQKKST